MRTRILVGALALLGAIAFALPAGAVNVNGVDYSLFARCKIGMENGPINIDGNIAVNEICGQQGGFLHLGINNIVTGSATANNMFFGSGASVGVCNFNNSTGGDPSAVCGAQNVANLPITQWGPLPVPAAVTPGNQDVVCPGPTCLDPLPAGDYRDIRLKDGATLNLSPGTYNARSILVEFNATLNGNGATVNLTNGFTTEPAANVSDITVTSVVGVVNAGPPVVCSGASGLGSTAEVIETGNGATVNNAVFYAPCARMHLHQGGTFTNFEGIAVLITVEPVTITPPTGGCACIGEVADGGQTILLSKGCHLNDTKNKFFVSPTCAIDASVACPGANCISTGAPVSASDAAAILNKPAANAGTYHVIVTSPGGAFCTVGTVNIP